MSVRKALVVCVGLMWLGVSAPAWGNCNHDWHCIGREWPIDCPGNWDCVDHECVAVCDFDLCGNGECDFHEGEYEQSCSVDCAIPAECNADIDCLDKEWLVDCLGNWDCVSGMCVEVCDFETCGDGECDIQAGESVQSCPTDCAIPAECNADIDCLDKEWLVDCLGNWDCVSGMCVEVCDFETCGDGECDIQGGESVQSCPADCRDCNSNGLPDRWDIFLRFSSDCNDNGIPDECDQIEACLYDLDNNCYVGPGDVGVVKYFFGCDIEEPACAALDLDGNGRVSPADVGVVKNNFGACPTK